MDARGLRQEGALLCRAVVRGEAVLADALPLLARRLGTDCGAVSVLTTDGGPGGVSTWGRPPIEPDEEAAWRRLLPSHPYYGHLATAPEPAHRLTDVVDIRRFTGTAVYTDLLRPFGARYQAAAVLEQSPDALVVLSLWRAHRDFADDEVAAFTPLARALAASRAYRRALDALAGPTADAAPAPGLTARRREVLDLVARGLTNDQVATRLGISPRTVRKHLAELFALTGASSRTELAVRWRAGDLTSRD